MRIKKTDTIQYTPIASATGTKGKEYKPGEDKWWPSEVKSVRRKKKKKKN